MKLKKTLHNEQMDFQKVDIVESTEWGRMLLLDDMVKTTEKDEFVDHEKAYTPTYPSGLWCFTLDSKKYDPLRVDQSRFGRFDEVGRREDEI